MARAAAYLYRHFGLPGAGLIFLLEGIGVPIPVEIPLGIIGFRMVHGGASYWSMVMLMWMSTNVGNTIGYFVGYYGGRPMALRLLGWFRIKPELWEKTETWFQKHGLKLVLVTRWINWGFAQNMWLCGITRVPFGRFFPIMVVNNLLWAMAWTLVAREAMRYFRRGFEILHDRTIQAALGALAVVLIGGLIWWVVRGRRKSPQRNGG